MVCEQWIEVLVLAVSLILIILFYADDFPVPPETSYSKTLCILIINLEKQRERERI